MHISNSDDTAPENEAITIICFLWKFAF